MAAPAAVLQILLTANATPATAALGKTQAQLKATGATATKTGAVMKKAFIGIGLAAAGAGVALFEIGKEFDDTYDKIRTTTGATGKELETLKDDFRAVVKSVPADFDTAGKAIARINQRLELTGHPLRRITKQFTELARITDTDVEENIQSVTRAFGDWEVKTGRQSEQLDIFFRASQASGASVSDLAQQVVQFGAPLRQLGFTLDESTAMFAAFEEAGVNTQTMMPGLKFALRSFMEAGKDPQMALQKTFEGIADGTLKAQEAFEIFGGRATPDMIEAIQQGRFDLDKLTDSISKSSDTIRDAGADTMDFGERWTLFKNNVLLALEPVATRVFGAVGDAMKELTNIMSDPKLSNDEKWDKMGDVISDKVAAWAPKIAEAAAKVGIALAKGLFRAFIDAPILGKLFLGGLFIRAIGGKGAILGIGKTIGGWIAGQMAARMAATTVAEQVATNIMGGPAAGKWKGLGGKIGTMVGRGFGPAFALAAVAMSFKAGLDFEEGPGGVSGLLTSDASKQFDEQAQKTIDKVWALEDEITRKKSRALRQRLRDLKEHGHLSAEQYGNFAQMVRDKTSAAERSSTRNLNQAADRGAKASSRLRGSVSDNIASLANAVAGGMKNIRDNTNKSLQAFGVKKLAFNIASVGEAVGNAVGRQQGGIVVPGTGTGDKVPMSAMVEPGEGVFVLNRNAMGALQGLNQAVPRFAKGGGMVAPQGGFPDAMGALPGLDALGWVLKQKFGLGVVSGLRPGAITTSGNPSDHGWGGAIDVSNGITTPQMDAAHAFMRQTLGGGGGFSSLFSGGAIKQMLYKTMVGGDHFNHIHVALVEAVARSAAAVMKLIGGKGGGFGLAEEIERVILNGPDGPLKDMGQSALDKVRKGANAYIAKQAPAMGGGGFEVGMRGDWVQALHEIAREHGWSQSAWMELVRRESGGNPEAVNPSSGAFGLGQFLGSTAQAYARYGALSHDPVQQIQAMARYISDRYGSPTAALAFHSANNWYKRGGALLPPYGGSFAGGGTVPGPIGAPRTVVAHGGEHIGGPMVLELHLHGSMDAVLDEVDALVDGKAPEIAEYVYREGGRNVARSRQLAGRAGRA